MQAILSELVRQDRLVIVVKTFTVCCAENQRARSAKLKELAARQTCWLSSKKLDDNLVPRARSNLHNVDVMSTLQGVNPVNLIGSQKVLYSPWVHLKKAEELLA